MCKPSLLSRLPLKASPGEQLVGNNIPVVSFLHHPLPALSDKLVKDFEQELKRELDVLAQELAPHTDGLTSAEVAKMCDEDTCKATSSGESTQVLKTKKGAESRTPEKTRKGQRRRQTDGLGPGRVQSPLTHESSTIFSKSGAERNMAETVNSSGSNQPVSLRKASAHSSGGLAAASPSFVSHTTRKCCNILKKGSRAPTEGLEERYLGQGNGQSHCQSKTTDGVTGEGIDIKPRLNTPRQDGAAPRARKSFALRDFPQVRNSIDDDRNRAMAAISSSLMETESRSTWTSVASWLRIPRNFSTVLIDVVVVAMVLGRCTPTALLLVPIVYVLVARTTYIR